MKEEDYDAVLDTNLKGAFHMIRHIVPLFLRSKEGSIVNVTSVAGLMGNAGQCNNAASKAGLVGLTKSVAKELAPKGIRINAVCPFYVRTPMTDRALEEKERLTGITVEESYRLEGEQVPLGYVAEPADIADPLVFLVSHASRYITGAIIPVSGGTHCGYGPVLSSFDEKADY